jgi:hypothetical protein
VGISEGGGKAHFPFWRAACVCVCLCEKVIYSLTSVHPEMGKTMSDSLTAFYPSPAPQNSLLQSSFEEMAAAKEGTSLSQIMWTSRGGSGG